MSVTRPIAAVGVICLRDDAVLLIRRGRPPLDGQWSLPGGKIEWGETATDAALRELREETGVDAEILGLVDVVDLIAEGRHYVLIDYAARWIAGEPIAGDDAAEAQFMAMEALPSLGLWPPTLAIIEKAGAAFGRA